MDFSLIETILLHKDSAFLLHSHLHRLYNSAKTFDFNYKTLEPALNYLNINMSHTHKNLDISKSLKLLAQSSLPHTDIKNHIINLTSHYIQTPQDSINSYHNSNHTNILNTSCTNNYAQASKLYTNMQWKPNSNTKISSHATLFKDNKIFKSLSAQQDKPHLYLWDCIDVLKILLQTKNTINTTSNIDSIQNHNQYAPDNTRYNNTSHNNTKENNQSDNTINPNSINLASTNDFSLCRLLLAKDGTLTYNIQPLQPITNTTIKLAVLKTTTQLSYHKTTMRLHFDKATTSIARNECFDYIYTNKDNEILEGSRSNVVITQNGKHYTPKRSLGLLAGTLRNTLIKQGICIEKTLYTQDLYRADAIYCVNSIRGIIPVKLDS
ncbi:aminotransferase class IV [Helicobacter trogontum]|nr:aminotransferase class IV [Helicobacter trogontum]